MNESEADIFFHNVGGFLPVMHLEGAEKDQKILPFLGGIGWEEHSCAAYACCWHRTG